MKLAHEKNYKIIIITSQSGIGRGYYTEDDMHRFNDHIRDVLSKNGVIIGRKDIYFCPHHPKKATIAEYLLDCDCRKPKPGLILKAAKEHDINLEESYMVGDKHSDVAAGVRAGCKGSILVMCGKSMDTKGEKKEEPTYVAEDLLDAVNFILSNDEK